MSNYGSFKGDNKQKALKNCLDEYNSINNNKSQHDLCIKYGISVNAMNYYKNTKCKNNTNQQGGEVKKKIYKIEEDVKNTVKQCKPKKLTKDEKNAEFFDCELKKDEYSDTIQSASKRRLTLDDFNLHDDEI